MNAIKCEICGSSEIIKQGGFFVCQYCGTKYSLEEARNLLGTVKIDKSDDIENLMTLATRSLRNNDYRQASTYYDQLLRELPNDPDMVFYSAYSAARVSKETEFSCEKLASAFETTIELLVNERRNNLERYVLPFVGLIISYCDDEALRITSSPNFSKYAASSRFEAIGDLGRAIENTLLQYFPESSTCVVEIRQSEIDFLNTLAGYCYSRQYIKQEKKRLSKKNLGEGI